MGNGTGTFHLLEYTNQSKSFDVDVVLMEIIVEDQLTSKTTTVMVSQLLSHANIVNHCPHQCCTYRSNFTDLNEIEGE